MPRKAKAPLSQPIFGEPVFQEEVPTPDPAQFKVTNDDEKFYTKEVQALLTKDVVSFDKATGNPADLFSLAEAWGPHGSDVINSINAAKSITFHMIGDSGASAQSKYASELKVADAVTNDFHTSAAATRPSFLYHLGDVVYNFGESLYYYDQFYEPFRNYPAPILAIPGNHDSFILPGTATADDPLTIFSRNFCGTSIVVTKEAGSLHRTCMTQPGVYFTLDAPFVRILGLFSNALEDPGVISSETTKGKAKWPTVPDYQLDFLTAQLQQIKTQQLSGSGNPCRSPSSIHLWSARRRLGRRQALRQSDHAVADRCHLQTDGRVSARDHLRTRAQLPALHARAHFCGEELLRPFHHLRRQRPQRQRANERQLRQESSRAWR